MPASKRFAGMARFTHMLLLMRNGISHKVGTNLENDFPSWMPQYSTMQYSCFLVLLFNWI
jgi:hypothetical protein